MIKKVRIAVDHGNRNMKTCSQVFTTGLTIQDKKPARGEKFLFYEGKYYVLSENRIPYQRDKTQDDRFFILTLFAIVKELEENPQIQPGDVIQVDLPIGLPPKHYAELCERYEAYFKRQGKIHDINYCGSTYHITIGEVMAFPQDYAAMMTMIEKLQQIPKVVGIDIGGFTTDYLLMRKGNPDMEACDSMEKGVITMYNKIISGINSEYDILLEESDIDSILQGNTEFYEEAVVRMTEGMVQDFVKDLLNSIVMLAESQKEGENLNRLTNRAVYLLCWMRRYLPKLFINWKSPEIGCFIYLGGCRNENEALFMSFLGRLPLDVLILCPDLNIKCCLEDKLLYEVNYPESLAITEYPEESSQKRLEQPLIMRKENLIL